MNDTSDSELLMLIRENNEEALKIIYERYDRLIKFILKGNSRTLKSLNINYNEAYSECLSALEEAITSFSDDRNVLFKTYATLLIERKIKKYIIKTGRKKNKILNEAISFEDNYNQLELPLINLIGDKDIDPLVKITKKENVNEIKEIIKNCLSSFEYAVVNLMLNNLNYQQIAKILNKSPKQIDNAIQRIRNKLKVEIARIYA